MTLVANSSALRTLPGIGLAEIEDRALLQCRVDRKYIVPIGDVEWLLSTLAPTAMALEIDGVRQFAYESLYFDTPDLTSYRLTAHRHRRRFKVRTRQYVDSGTCFLEVKVPGARGSTVKYRTAHDPDSYDSILPGRAFVDDIFARHDLHDWMRHDLGPTLSTRYLRCTLLLTDSDSRVTVDTDLRWTTERGELHLPEMAIIETKTGSAASSADRHLRQRGRRNVAVSKYATGLAALHTDLPAAPWRRVLRRHFSPLKEGPVHG